jgi:mono/diheme cytochrome c family protein
VRDRTTRLVRNPLTWFAYVAVIAMVSNPTLARAADVSNKPTAIPERRGTELGFAVFQQHCVSCHGNPAFERAPSPAALRSMSPERIYTALTTGIMKSVGDTLDEADRRRVAESLAGQLLGSSQAGDASTMPNRCANNPPLHDSGKSDWNGWGNGSENTRFQSAAASGLTPESVPHLQLKWAFGFPGGTSAYGQPTVFAGRVFVGSDIGYVYSLDDTLAYFGLNAGGVAAVRLTDGQRVWYTPLNSGAEKKVTHSAAATVIPGVVFVGGSDGRLWALSSGDGQPLWSFDTARTFDTVNRVPAHDGSIIAPGATVADGMLFVGSGYGVVAESPGNVLLAFGVP